MRRLSAGCGAATPTLTIMDVTEVLPGLLYQFRFVVGQAYLWRDVDSLT
jgi:hypothetical protein